MVHHSPKRARLGFLASATLLALASLQAAPALADSESKFINTVAGRWSGPGEIVAGKYKGTRFTCDLTGLSPKGQADVDLDGTCRVGVFSQSMKASVRRSGKAFKGQFLDGAAGKGLDITSGRVDGNKAVFSLKRQQLNGAMLAHLPARDQMTVTISVKVADQMVPVIAMNLKRVDGTNTASID